MKPLILWHRADFDGVCSAAIAKKFVPDAELHGIDYGDEFPWDEVSPRLGEMEATPGGAARSDPERPGIALVRDPGLRWPIEKRTVYLLDFSLPPEGMKKLATCCDLVWIDHHKSAIDWYESQEGENRERFIAGWRHLEKAACEICWDYFCVCVAGNGQEQNVPEAVRLLGRYDVFDEKNPDWARIEAFQLGMRSMNVMDPEDFRWNTLLASPADLVADAEAETHINEIVMRGRAILSYRDQEAKALCADGCREETIYTQDFVPVRADGGAIRPHRLVCLNSLQRGSWLFKSVWDPEKHDAMCVYGQLKDGRWRVSLYSTKPEVDCGAIAKSLGGGGHKGAAGFICEKLPWENG